MSLDELFDARTARIGVIGLGYVGLPLAHAFCDAGFPVTGFDVDEAKVASLAEGRSYIGAVPDEALAPLVAEGRFKATTDFTLLGGMNAVLVCVPTPLTKNREPDLSYVENTVRTIALYLNRGQLILLESTTYPGTTREVVQPILEQNGMKAGKDFFLAYSPEREDPGNKHFGTRSIPKVVGGVDETSGRFAAALYDKAVKEVVLVRDADTAEATKILENVYRAVNIALVNELKILFERMGIDVWEVIRAAATKPFGYTAFWPGPGLGGHCIPIDPFYLSWKAREYDLPARFIELAGEINSNMPRYVVAKIAGALNDRGRALPGAKVLIVGVAYKKDVDDVRESPALRIMQLLQERGVGVHYHDPHVPHVSRGRQYHFDLDSEDLGDALVASMDAVVILTEHSSIDYERIVRHAGLVVDTRNATAGIEAEPGKIVKA